MGINNKKAIKRLKKFKDQTQRIIASFSFERGKIAEGYDSIF